MTRSRFTESQIVQILKEGQAGIGLGGLPRKHGISLATHFNWRSKYGGVPVSELKRMKQLALENAAIKVLLSRKLQSGSRSNGRPRCL
jgi:putative transposase